MFADIIINISVEALDRTFQYIVPAELEKKATIGSHVSIPFGKGNRVMGGYIIAFSDTNRYPADKLKKILKIDEDKVVPEAKMLKLASFIKEEYGGTMNEALKTVLPIKKQIQTKKEENIIFIGTKETLINELETAKTKKFAAKVRFLEGLIKEHGEMTLSHARKEYDVTRNVVNSFMKKNLIRIETKRVSRTPFDIKDVSNRNIVLNENQKMIVEDFLNEYSKDKRGTYLLHGITGSGKTEVYINIIGDVIKKGKQVIVLIPEIALTRQMIVRFTETFGERVAVLHSRMSQGEKYDLYCMARNKKIDIVIGPRSALFVPFEEIGLIIIDEEHENSYKSEGTPKYHAREVAIYRAKMDHASVLLGSATPSVESFSKAMSGEYKYYSLTERAGAGQLPSVYVADLREELKEKNMSIFSRELKKQMEECLARKEQIMLFLNRRGYAGFVSCRCCGNVLKCPHCDVSLKAHRYKITSGEVKEVLKCHYCGYQMEMPDKCPECGSPYIASFGLGTQKVEETTKKLFPNARVGRMDADTTTGKNGHEAVLGRFRNHEIDILIGTQMIVKGHDFKKVTLVGILAADLSMYSNDYHSGERTFQLIMQAAGRAGRDKLPGSVVIQTYNPDHYCIKAAANQDYLEFYENEMAYRRMLHYPPVWDILVVIVSSKNEMECDRSIKLLHKEITEKTEEDITIIGPAQAGIYRVNDYYRQVLYIKSNNSDKLQKIKKHLEVVCEIKINKKICSIQFDKNPMNSY